VLDRRGRERLFFGEGRPVRVATWWRRGGRLGPDLSRIGAARAPAVLTESSAAERAFWRPAMERSAWSHAADPTITGVLRNEDTFSLAADGRQGGAASSFEEDLKESLPAPAADAGYPEGRLDGAKLRDLVAFLAGLRATPTGRHHVGPQWRSGSLRAPAGASKGTRELLSYSGGFAGPPVQGLLKRVDTRNARDLGVRWSFNRNARQIRDERRSSVDGVMFVTVREPRVALDARTGRPIWHYRRSLPEKVACVCGRVNRGVAALGDACFSQPSTPHCALDAKTGTSLWERGGSGHKLGYRHAGTLAQRQGHVGVPAAN